MLPASSTLLPGCGLPYAFPRFSTLSLFFSRHWNQKSELIYSVISQQVCPKNRSRWLPPHYLYMMFCGQECPGWQAGLMPRSSCPTQNGLHVFLGVFVLFCLVFFYFKKLIFSYISKRERESWVGRIWEELGIKGGKRIWLKHSAWKECFIKIKEKECPMCFQLPGMGPKHPE